MKTITFMNGIAQYENLLEENNIIITCNENMDMIISDEDVEKLMALITCNEMDIIIEDYKS